jgi:hypothetical protein
MHVISRQTCAVRRYAQTGKKISSRRNMVRDKIISTDTIDLVPYAKKIPESLAVAVIQCAFYARTAASSSTSGAEPFSVHPRAACRVLAILSKMNRQAVDAASTKNIHDAATKCCIQTHG